MAAKARADKLGIALDVDILVQSEQWRAHRGARAAVRRALAVAAATVPQLRRSGAEVAIVLTDDAAIRILNRQWRGQNKPTNVLSFPAPAVGVPPRAPKSLGDIVIAYETLAREAEQAGKPFAHHLAHLAVHGFLHLVGFDHEDDAEAERMERRERAILATLGVPDPYADPPPARAIKTRR
jgi:probable rRNA maturation factor